MPGYDRGVFDRISSILTAESTSDGALKCSLRAVDGAAGFRLQPATLTLSMWRVDMEIVRVSLENPKTGTVAYFQGAEPALSLAHELGLELIPFMKESR